MSHLTRLGALVATGALTATGLVASVTAPAQAVGTDSRPAAIGASWLESQLTNGIVVGRYLDGDTVKTYDDFGLTLDIGLSLASLTGHGATVDAIRDALGPRVDEAYDSFGTTYTGSAAKAAVFADVAGADPSNFDGTDVLGVVEDNTASTAPIAGRIENVNDSFGDANVFGQAFAARALAVAGSSKAADALSFLLAQQCDAGFFRLDFTTDKTAQDQTCQGGVGTDASVPDTDATALAALQLAAMPGADTDPIKSALTDARSWLASTQRSDGSFGGGPSTEGSNSNSTGLAGWALGTLGDSAAATRAAVWVRGLQADEETACPNKLSDQRGAIAYDRPASASGLSEGITIGSEDQWRRATAPILPVLQWAPAATSALSLTGPTGYLKAGSVATYRVSGAAPGDKVCVSGIGAARRVVAPPSGSFAVALTMPAGTANRVATAAVHGSSDGLLVQILGAKKLTVTPGRKIKHRGTRLRVVVTGLAPAEPVRLRYRGVTVRKGVADPSGRFVRHIRVGHRLGKARIVAWGKFSAIRHGRVYIRVVR